MKIAFVAAMKERDLKKAFPWVKARIPFLGGHVLLDTERPQALEKEMIRLGKKELDRMRVSLRRREMWERKFKQHGAARSPRHAKIKK